MSKIFKSEINIMKTQVPVLLLIFTLSTLICKVNAQSLQVSAELKELIGLSINKDHRIVEKNIDIQIAEDIGILAQRP